MNTHLQNGILLQRTKDNLIGEYKVKRNYGGYQVPYSSGIPKNFKYVEDTGVPTSQAIQTESGWAKRKNIPGHQNQSRYLPYRTHTVPLR